MVIAVFVIIPSVLPTICTIGEEAQGRLGLTNKLWCVVENEAASWVSATDPKVKSNPQAVFTGTVSSNKVVGHHCLTR